MTQVKRAMTLDRMLSRQGHASRTAARGAIEMARVKINGHGVRDPECWVRPGEDAVRVDGKALAPARKVYLLIYKPKGVITSHGDPADRRTVYDSLGEQRAWVAPVGRLDKDTLGLLLLTNDTAFADFVAARESPRPTWRKSTC